MRRARHRGDGVPLEHFGPDRTIYAGDYPICLQATSGCPEYREKRSNWGISVLGALVVEIETEGGVVGCGMELADRGKLVAVE